MKWGLMLSVTSCGVKLRSVPDVIDIELYMGVRRYFSLKVQLHISEDWAQRTSEWTLGEKFHIYSRMY